MSKNDLIYYLGKLEYFKLETNFEKSRLKYNLSIVKW